MRRTLMLGLLFLIAGCMSTNTSRVAVVADEALVDHCRYLGTVSEISDPSRLLPELRVNDSQQKVLERAWMMGGTHVTWLYHYRQATAIMVYRCEDPPEARAVNSANIIR